jgi:hypothetical protein
MGQIRVHLAELTATISPGENSFGSSLGRPSFMLATPNLSSVPTGGFTISSLRSLQGREVCL